MGILVMFATTKDVPPGTAKAVEAEGRKIALFNSGGAYYASCADARAAGAAPLRRGDPGYRAGLDRDDDGVACE